MAGVYPIILLATGLFLKQDSSLRAGCAPSDEVITEVQTGSPAEIRFAMSGSAETCYKIAVKSKDKTWEGYVPASALAGLEEFTKQVQQAPSVAATNSAPINLPPVQGSPDHPLVKASRLLEDRQPRAALDAVEQGMRVYGREYQFLLLAGIAAYQADETRIALDYLRDSQRLHEDLPVRHLIAKLEKEQSADIER